MSVTLAEIEPMMLKAIAVAIDFYHYTGKPLGITGEVGEYWAAKLLDLELADARTPGYDLVDQNGKRIQIKTRLLQDTKKLSGQRMGSIKRESEFDSVILVILQNDFEPFAIYEASREQVLAALTKTEAKSRQRGSLDISEFKRMGTQRWPQTSENLSTSA